MNKSLRIIVLAALFVIFVNQNKVVAQSKLDGFWKVELKETSGVIGCFGYIWEKLEIKNGMISTFGLNHSDRGFFHILETHKLVIGKPFSFRTAGSSDQGTATGTFQENIAHGSWVPDKDRCTLDFTLRKIN